MAKQQAPVVSSDDADDIIDLTEIVQKGKPPLASKPDVDFDSALSDLMGKTPAMKLDETPELEALLSGIDEDAPARKPGYNKAYDTPEEDSRPLADADDMDSLLTSLEGKSRKNEQPADEVDSMLDSLMDGLNPPDMAADAGQNVSDADLDDLLSSIEQDSKQTAKTETAAPKTPDDLDDLLAGLEFAPDPKRDPVKAPDDLDELLAGLKKPASASAPEQVKPKPAPEPEDIPEAKPQGVTSESIDDMLDGLDFSAPAPAPAPKKDVPKAPDDLDALLAGLKGDAAEPQKAEPKAEPRPQANPQANSVDSIDDLLAGLDNLAKPAPTKPVAEKAVPEAENAVRGIPDADLDDLLAGLDAATTPKKSPAKDAPAPQADSKVDFGDLGSLLDGTTDAEESEQPDDDPFAAALAAASASADTDAPDAPDAPVSFDKPAFDAKDFDDLDALFAEKSSEKTAAPVAEVPAPVLSVDAETATRLPELIERLDKVEADFRTLQERVEALESRPVAESQPPLADMLAEGSPLCDRLMELVRAAMTQELQALSSRVDATNESVNALEGRAVAVDSRLDEVAAIAETAAKTLADSEKSDTPTGISPADLEPLTERLNALEASAVRQQELDVQAERLDLLEEQSSRIDLLEEQSSRIDLLEEQSSRIGMLEEQSSRLAALEEQAASAVSQSPDSQALEVLESRLASLEEQSSRIAALEVLESRLASLEAQAASAVSQSTGAEPTEISAAEEDETANPEASGPDSAVSSEILGKLDQRLTALEARPYVPLETIQGAFDQMGEQLNAPLQQFQNRITLLEQRLADDALHDLASDLLPFMGASIDKAAAASAAQALREELAALMADGGDDADADDGGDR